VKDPTSIFVKYAQNINLDIEKFKTDLTSEQAKERIINDYKGGVKAGIVGTPTFFVNGKQIASPKSLNEFKDIINKAATAGVNP
ncbi:MAG: thioredoxin domain-containing protein, partial [Patescibacteria group bacterium]